MSTPWKCLFPVLGQFPAPAVNRAVGDAQLTRYLRDGLPARLRQPHGFLFEFFRVDLLDLSHR